MPRLHQYRNRNAYYVKTAIRGTVVTFQLTPEGERKLIAAGITVDQPFERAFLLDLYRTGDAFTFGTGVDKATEDSLNQLELDFAQDPDAETAFPACEDCRSVDDLHLILLREEEGLTAKLQCQSCRNQSATNLDTCIPFRLLSRPILGRLFDIKDVKRKYDSVSCLEDLFNAEFESKWEELRRRRGVSQGSLFEPERADELNLLQSKK